MNSVEENKKNKKYSLQEVSVEYWASAGNPFTIITEVLPGYPDQFAANTNMKITYIKKLMWGQSRRQAWLQGLRGYDFLPL